ncbi:tyrosyl-tRNA synthetase [Grosmannia clavigera kw1407]|uniref:Tyrosine--tRNA ligase n=1 Tax=Grosmannia clavigera (strain kw1407 / UAMH 11150) TaxID=655863 RepID=F0XDP8_GROCL|nr:tyrosyl-tRNA synthetase [Grosmannia clavigera kw1407]EFX03531.1 tyrosyl-tRNA synthetase [Grosmannia clavigera kw1407]
MPLPAVTRRWPAPGAQICRRCARQLFLEPQRRNVTGKSFAKYGPKYQAKIDQADAEWETRAALIEGGGAKAMWDIFEERGYVKDVAGNREDIRKLLTQKRIGAYVGIDPTAPSMHVGHLLPLMPLFWMYMHGYRAVTLLGGATGKIGDPTDRLQSRAELKNATVAMNMVKMHYQLKKLWVNVEAQARRYGYEKTWAWRRGVLQNGHWWNKLPMLEILQRLGAGLRIGPMLSRDTVRRKLTEGDGMSFAEFSYPLMQAWDWWHMYISQGIQMQIGGSDQYGNIVTGADAFKIIRASEPNPALKLSSGLLHDPVGFTVPLLTDSSGAKFGKSAGNAIWLDRFQTPTFDLYGYFVRRPDADVEALLRLFTFIPLDRITALMEDHTVDPARRLAQHTLAFEVVALVHGLELATEARDRHRAMYDKKKLTNQNDGDDAIMATTSATTVATDAYPRTLNQAPQVDLQLPAALFRAGKVARILYAAGMVKSVSEGNRLAIQKGAYVGASPGQTAHHNKGMPLTQVDFTPVHLWYPEDTKNFIIDEKYMVLRKGQHNVRVIEIVSDEEWEASGRTYPGQPYTGRVRELREQLKMLKAGLSQIDGKNGKNGKNGKDGKSGGDGDGGDDQGKLVFPDEKTEQVRALEEDIRQELLRQDGK